MSLSRTVGLMRLASATMRKPPLAISTQIRHGSGQWSYRRGGYGPTKSQAIVSEALLGFFIWWVLWHMWHEPGHIIGEWTLPDPSKWTDEELGIPKQ